jgi:hypothetical protein
MMISTLEHTRSRSLLATWLAAVKGYFIHRNAPLPVANAFDL